MSLLSVSAYDIIRGVVNTEKTVKATESLKAITLLVDPKSNKTQIKSAVQDVLGLKVKSVNIMNYSGVKKRFRGKLGTTAARKKAVVYLAADQDIDFSNLV
jgi:large subunit ribosomal protein L23